MTILTKHFKLDFDQLKMYKFKTSSGKFLKVKIMFEKYTLI